MWWLNNQSIIFYVPAKKNMAVYKDAIALVDAGIGILQVRTKKRYVGYGKDKQSVEDRYEVVGVAGLTTQSGNWITGQVDYQTGDMDITTNHKYPEEAKMVEHFKEGIALFLERINGSTDPVD